MIIMNMIIEEIQKAILRQEKQYKGIPSPTPQTHGTYTQQSSYAKLKAMQIHDTFFVGIKANTIS